MYLSKSNIAPMRELIAMLYARPFDEALILDVAKGACRLMDAHYSSFYVLGLHKLSKPRFIVSNNPSDFLPVYFSIAHEDFLLDTLIATRKDYVASRWPHHGLPGNKNFMGEVQRARPISDMVYSPLMVRGRLLGFWSMARAGLDSPCFSDDQLEVFGFVKTFLNEAFERSLIPQPVDEDLAYLDYRGRIVGAGARIKDSLDRAFGRELILGSSSCHDDLRARFREGYRRFLRGPAARQADRLSLSSEGKTYTFIFRLLRSNAFGLRDEGLPYASVALVDEGTEAGMDGALDLPALSREYGFTPRETEVISGIYGGLSNKAIACALGIDESTVKRHSHNIYAKSGFRTRVELVLGLSNLRQTQLKL